MKKELFICAVTIVMSAFPIITEAQIKAYQGVYYRFDGSSNTSYYAVVLNQKEQSNTVSGSITIPSQITYPGGKTVHTVTSVAASAFADQTKLTSISLPSTVTNIGTDAFKNCTGLTYFGGGGFTTMGTQLKGLPNLQKVSIPSTVTSISTYAFDSCINLSTVTFLATSSVKSIGNSAFRNCKKLSSISIPSSVTTLYQSAFEGSGLTKITIPSSITSNYGSAFRDCPELEQATINNELVAGYQFYNCPKLKTVTFSNNVRSISAYAFSKTGFTSVTIPKTITIVSNYAFYECPELTSVTLNQAVINERCFAKCGNLKAVTLPAVLKTIQQYAFAEDTSLISLSIPDSVKSINGTCCAYCSAFTTYYVSDKNQDFYSEDGILFNTVNNLVSYPCGKKGSSYSVPNKTKYVLTGAFCGNVYLKSVAMDSVQSIYLNAFTDARSLEKVRFGDSLKVIGISAFSGCQQLSEIELPKSLETINSKAFQNCIGLKKIVSHLKTPPTTAADAFEGVPTDIPVYVPQGYAQLYKGTEGWYNFTNYIEFDEKGDVVVEFNDDEGNVVVSKTDNENIVVVTATPAEGYEFVEWSDGNTDNPRTIDISGGVTISITAVFQKTATPDKFTITVASLNPEMGSTIGSGEYEKGASVIIAAIPNQGYQFKQWIDSNTDNPRTILVTENASYVAMFEAVTAVEDILSEREIQELLNDPMTHIYTLQGIEVTSNKEDLPASVYIFRNGDKAGKLYLK